MFRPYTAIMRQRLVDQNRRTVSACNILILHTTAACRRRLRTDVKMCLSP
jgi:hypothetical protein